MATQPATPITRRQMIEATAPEMFQFTKIGQDIEGVLLSIEPRQVTDKKTGEQKEAIEYMLGNAKGERITFLGMNDLNKKIVPGHIGHFLQIRYERDDSSFTKPGQSPAKLFKVLVAKDKEPGF
jgi:hypothetical protein